MICQDVLLIKLNDHDRRLFEILFSKIKTQAVFMLGSIFYSLLSPSVGFLAVDFLAVVPLVDFLAAVPVDGFLPAVLLAAGFLLPVLFGAGFFAVPVLGVGALGLVSLGSSLAASASACGSITTAAGGSGAGG